MLIAERGLSTLRAKRVRMERRQPRHFTEPDFDYPAIRPLLDLPNSRIAHVLTAAYQLVEMQPGYEIEPVYCDSDFNANTPSHLNVLEQLAGRRGQVRTRKRADSIRRVNFGTPHKCLGSAFVHFERLGPKRKLQYTGHVPCAE